MIGRISIVPMRALGWRLAIATASSRSCTSTIKVAAELLAGFGERLGNPPVLLLTPWSSGAARNRQRPACAETSGPDLRDERGGPALRGPPVPPAVVQPLLRAVPRLDLARHDIDTRERTRPLRFGPQRSKSLRSETPRHSAARRCCRERGLLFLVDFMCRRATTR